MKNYIKELLVLLLQICIFYIIPLFSTIDAIGMILLIIILTFILSIIIGCISNKKIKYFYPVITAIIFIPSIFIYYNESAIIHSTWYFIDSLFGLILGIFIKKK